MYSMQSSEYIQYTTIRIETKLSDGSTSTGTGFFYLIETYKANFSCIITNKHVVQNSVSCILRFTISKNNEPQVTKIVEYEISDFEKKCIYHPDPNIDLCAFPIFEILDKAKDSGIELFFVQYDKGTLITDEELNLLSLSEEIIMIGYPNGIWDKFNNLPIYRRGITATSPKLNYNGNEEFIIDAACFPGSSGSPVLLHNEGSYCIQGMTVFNSRFKLLGILYGGPQYISAGKLKKFHLPTIQTTIPVLPIPINLGFVIKAKKILELQSEFERQIRLVDLNS